VTAVNETSERRTIVTIEGDIYEVQSQLGVGGMGIVYLAKQVSLGRLVALKMVRADQLGAPQMLQRLRQEAMGAALIDHPNIVKVFSLVMSDRKEPFLVMEYVEGKTLADLLADGTPSRDRFFDIFEQALAGLQAAHEAGLVHRDISPNNIMLANDGRVKLMDFGIAKHTIASSSQVKTGTGVVMGAPRYMSPEQCTAQTVGPQSDLYSLACVMFQTLTGRPPFDGDLPLALLRQHVDDLPPPLPENCGEALEKVIHKAMEKRPEKRYASAAEMLTALQAAKAAPSRKPSQYFRLNHAVRRMHLSSARTLAVALVVATICGAILFTKVKKHEGPSENPAGEIATETLDSAEGAAQRLMHQARQAHSPAEAQALRAKAKQMVLKAIALGPRGHWSRSIRQAYDDLRKLETPADRKATWLDEIAASERTGGKISEPLADNWKDYGCYLMDQGDDAAAEASLRKALSIYAALNEQQPPSSEMLRTTTTLIECYLAEGKLQQAQQTATEAIAKASAAGAGRSLEVQMLHERLGDVLIKIGRPDAALSEWKQAADTCVKLAEMPVSDAPTLYTHPTRIYMTIARYYNNIKRDKASAVLYANRAGDCLRKARFAPDDWQGRDYTAVLTTEHAQLVRQLASGH
jgi:serine/threonine protein kinase